MANSYPGESFQKKIARAIAYDILDSRFRKSNMFWRGIGAIIDDSPCPRLSRHVNAMFPWYREAGGFDTFGADLLLNSGVVCLAGHGGDVNPLKAINQFLGLPPAESEVAQMVRQALSAHDDPWSLVHFIDNDMEAIDRVMAMAPRANFHNSGLHEVSFPTKIGLAVIDLCGTPENTADNRNWDGICNVGRQMAEDSMMVITTCRAHERPGTASYRAMKHSTQTQRDFARSRTIVRRLSDALNIPWTIRGTPTSIRKTRPRITLQSCISYTAHASKGEPAHPMLMTLLHLSKHGLMDLGMDKYPMQVEVKSVLGKRPRFLKFLDDLGSVPFDTSAPEDRYLHQRACLLLNIQQSSIAAWKAHVSMGTYSKSNPKQRRLGGV